MFDKLLGTKCPLCGRRVRKGQPWGEKTVHAWCYRSAMALDDDIWREKTPGR